MPLRLASWRSSHLHCCCYWTLVLGICCHDHSSARQHGGRCALLHSVWNKGSRYARGNSNHKFKIGVRCLLYCDQGLVQSHLRGPDVKPFQSQPISVVSIWGGITDSCVLSHAELTNPGITYNTLFYFIFHPWRCWSSPIFANHLHEARNQFCIVHTDTVTSFSWRLYLKRNSPATS